MAGEYDKILGEITTNTDSISAATSETKEIRTLVDDGNQVNDKGWKALMDKLEVITTIQGWDAHIKKIGDSPYATSVNSISSAVTSIANNMATVSSNVQRMEQYLASIERKITGFSTRDTSKAENSSGGTGTIEGVHDTVKKIYTTLQEILPVTRNWTNSSR